VEKSAVAPLRRKSAPEGCALWDVHDHYQQLQGKELSYNNILDITSATYLIGEFERPTVAILKHTNPLWRRERGHADRGLGKSLRDGPAGAVWRPSSSSNQTLDQKLAEAIAEIFTEVIIAPRFSDAALQIFGKKKISA